ncbi:MAG: zinc-ribbon domain-containing protein [Thermoplasmata archaeon]
MDVEVSQDIAAGDYWLYTMFLDEGQKVEYGLSVSPGQADFYFFDGEQLSQFLANASGWSYDAAMSQLDSSSAHRSGSIDSTGPYHIAVANDNNYSVTLVGFIKASYPTSFLTIALVVGVIAAAVVLVLVVIVSRQNKALQQSVETYEVPFRSPPPPPRTTASYTPTGHQAHIDHTARRCRNCGTLLVPGATFCKFCGARVAP